jgi:hypothetical protein
MLALLALIPLRDKLYAALILALVLAGAWEYRHIEAVQAAKDAAADAKVAAAAAAAVQKSASDYAAQLKVIEDANAQTLAAAAATADSLTARLRVYEARRCPVLQGPAASPAGGAPVASGPDPVADAVAGLIRAAEHDLVVINAERAEREALTGK